jgi:hypothetical protein
MSKIASFILAFLLFGVALIPVSDAALLYGIEALSNPDEVNNRYNRLVTVDTNSGEVKEIGIINAPLNSGGLDFDLNGNLHQAHGQPSVYTRSTKITAPRQRSQILSQIRLQLKP